MANQTIRRDWNHETLRTIYDCRQCFSPCSLSGGSGWCRLFVQRVARGARK